MYPLSQTLWYTLTAQIAVQDCALALQHKEIPWHTPLIDCVPADRLTRAVGFTAGCGVHIWDRAGVSREHRLLCARMGVQGRAGAADGAAHE